uniref:Carcinustatin-20 n=1 Tax=Carcinus maenas TaxID=6759 RepID=ALL20_CARMA|nr:RecName: Full=Carcinustatin-20 [Carcinus maenas]
GYEDEDEDRPFYALGLGKRPRTYSFGL